jgi:hypothetical protein
VRPGRHATSCCGEDFVVKEFEVNCINKPNRESSHEHITHIGNMNGNWRLTRESAIQRIESNTEAFFTVDKQTSKRVYVGVVRESGKAPYLRTHADGKWNNNLLAQQECGSSCSVVS